MQEEGEAGAPLPPQLGLVQGRRSGGQHADRRVAHLPAVAVRAVQDVAAPPFRKAGNPGQFVAQAGGHQQPGRQDLRAAVECDPEGPVGQAFQPGDGAGDDVAAVAGHFGTAAGQQVGGRDAFVAEVGVDTGGGGVAGVARVDDEHGTPGAAQGERAAQPGGSAADDHDVVALRCGESPRGCFGHE